MMDAITQTEANFAARVDQHVGDRIRRRRIMMGLTQEQLAEALQISYQQIQKYETGANRISAGRLFQISTYLETSVGHFFDGLTLGGSMGPIEDSDSIETGLSSRSVIELVRNFQSIADPSIKTSVSQLIKSLSNQDNEVSSANGMAAENGVDHADDAAHRANGAAKSNGHSQQNGSAN